MLPYSARYSLDMNPLLAPSRRDELIGAIAGRLRAWNLSSPAILLLHMHAPLSFLLSQLLLFAQPVTGFFAIEALTRDLAFLLEEPENIERLIERLESTS